MFYYPEATDGNNTVCLANHTPKQIVIPDFIHRAIKLHNLNVIDIQDYSKMRAICSIDDLAAWTAIGEASTVHGKRISDYNNSGFFSNLSSEFYNSVHPLSQTEEKRTSAIEFLFSQVDQDDPLYEIMSAGQVTLIVIQPGFIYSLEKSQDKLLDFLRSTIKKMEELTSLEEAANTSLFTLFLQSTARTIG